MTNYDDLNIKIRPLRMSKEEMAKYLPCRCCIYYRGNPIKECIIGTAKCFVGREKWLEQEAEND